MYKCIIVICYMYCGIKEMRPVVCLQLIWLHALNVYATTNINSLQWTAGGLRVAITTQYAAYPAAKRLLVMGLGNCAVQMQDSWQRHFTEGDWAPTGDCDTWVSNSTSPGNDLSFYFGDASLQPAYSDYPELTRTGLLYGFDTLPASAGKVNRLYKTPTITTKTEWRFAGDVAITEPTSSTFLPLYVELHSSYAQLANCHKFGGSNALTISTVQGRTTYTFGVYVLTIEMGANDQVVTDCAQRQFTHSVGSSVSGTWGGFAIDDDATAVAAPLGVKAEYVLLLEMDAQEAAAVASNELLFVALEQQLLSFLLTLVSDAWVIDLDMANVFLAARRSSTYSVAFTVTLTMAGSAIATNDVALMSAVLRQVVDSAISGSPTFKQDFVNGWQNAYIALSNGAWPLPSVQLAANPFVITLEPVMLTVAPTPAPGQPTAAPTLPDDRSEGFPIWAAVTIASGAFLILGVALLIVIRWCDDGAHITAGGRARQKFEPLQTVEM